LNAAAQFRVGRNKKARRLLRRATFRLTCKIALSQARPRVVRPVMMVMMRQGGGKDCHKAIVYQTARIFWSCLTLFSSQSCFTKRTEWQVNRFGVYGLDSTRINELIRARNEEPEASMDD